jgi:cell division protein FtsW
MDGTFMNMQNSGTTGNKQGGLGRYFQGDQVVWRIILFLSVVSVLAVYSSTGTLAYKFQGGNTAHYVLKHLSLLLVGVGITLFAHFISYKLYMKLAKLFLYLTIPLLLFTLLMGVNLNSASRWVTIPGIGLTFQTSDFAKLSLIMFVAQVLARNQDSIRNWRKALLPAVAASVIVCGLIFPANFSTAAMLFAIIIALLFIGRIPMRQLAALMGLIAAAGALLFALVFTAPEIFPRGRTWKARIENFSKPDATGNYQAEQAKIAVASGGLFGKMPGKSTQRNFLPHPYSDFIFSIIVEEYGLLGGFLILMAYLTLLYRGIVIAKGCDTVFPALLAIGISFSLVFQALINMAVAVNLFPVTGQTLPLLSMGGSSILFTSFALGIMLSISRHAHKKNPKAAKHPGQHQDSQMFATA